MVYKVKVIRKLPKNAIYDLRIIWQILKIIWSGIVILWIIFLFFKNKLSWLEFVEKEKYIAQLENLYEDHQAKMDIANVYARLHQDREDYKVFNKTPINKQLDVYNIIEIEKVKYNFGLSKEELNRAKDISLIGILKDQENNSKLYKALQSQLYWVLDEDVAKLEWMKQNPYVEIDDNYIALEEKLLLQMTYSEKKYMFILLNKAYLETMKIELADKTKINLYDLIINHAKTHLLALSIYENYG